MLTKIATLLAIIVLLYFIAFFVVVPQFDAKGRRKLPKNILFVTAHPDDECM